MHLKNLKLQNFRNHKKGEWEFGNKILIVGENGSGKSNMLEAIYMLATGKSFRAEREDEMIAYDQNFSTLIYSFMTGGEQAEAQISMTDGTIGVTRKKFEVNGVAKRMIDFTGYFRAVLFGPQDMDLLTGSPSGRRKYLDFVISQADREYRRCLISYEKGLRQRNKLLERIREGEASRNQLFFWDRLLVKNGDYISRRREDYLLKLNSRETGFESVYDRSVISEARLKQYEIEEVAAAATLVGPHRDDFGVIAHNSQLNTHSEGRDVAKFGSRGEQRMAVMWLKKGELAYLTMGGEEPVLLLDDIFSELDKNHRFQIEEEVGRLAGNGGQSIVTTTEEEISGELKDALIIRL